MLVGIIERVIKKQTAVIEIEEKNRKRKDSPHIIKLSSFVHSPYFNSTLLSIIERRIIYKYIFITFSWYPYIYLNTGEGWVSCPSRDQGSLLWIKSEAWHCWLLSILHVYRGSWRQEVLGQIRHIFWKKCQYVVFAHWVLSCPVQWAMWKGGGHTCSPRLNRSQKYHLLGPVIMGSYWLLYCIYKLFCEETFEKHLLFLAKYKHLSPTPTSE